MNRHYRALVIGGGVVGCNVLWHLTGEGWSDVALCERRELTAGATWHSSGHVSAYTGDLTLVELARYTRIQIDRLRTEVEQDLGLACLMTETLGNEDQPHVQERLGELIMYLEVMKGGLRAAEAEAYVDQWGVLTPPYAKVASVRSLYARIFNPRMIEVIQSAGFQQPNGPTWAGLISRARCARNWRGIMATETADAMDRARLSSTWLGMFRAVPFGSRQLHYERHFAGQSGG